MFGSKLRSWMEAVRPRKKQHRKDKQTKPLNNVNNSVSSSNWQNTTNYRSQNDLSAENGNGNGRKQQTTSSATLPQNQQPPPAATSSRYSANNLSSPESAYSTGYSTDGTSPGAPPDYYINIRTGVKYFPTENGAGTNERYPNLNEHQVRLMQQRLVNGDQIEPPCRPKPTPLPPPPPPTKQNASSIRAASGCVPVVTVHQATTRRQDDRATPIPSRSPVAFSNQGNSNNASANAAAPSARLGTDVIASPVLTSPRQRNRIRTNPWLPGSSLSPGAIRQDLPKMNPLPLTDSPLSRRFFSPSAKRAANLRKQSLSSSSCSSLSGTSLHWEPKKAIAHSGSDEDDCTLNEMMGKYDESYVYEKETDILSDSDPTDCDTDIDTGQDGGDEDDPLEREFDFIDNGSYLEIDAKDDRNTGHCTYYNFDVQQQRKSSRRRTTRRSKQQTSEKRRRSSSNKKRHKISTSSEHQRSLAPLQPQNGSKSAGATPLSVRRTKHHPVSKLALEDCLKKRSNSISFSRDPITTIDKRDKEADKKYKELIGEAEQILRSMKINGLSPRRVPGPANKRVELLRSAECANKSELFMKNRLIEEQSGGPQFNKIPSNNNNFSCPRFSPKRNHITNFINNNSPVPMRRDVVESPLVGKKMYAMSPIVMRNNSNNGHRVESTNRRPSPKYRKKVCKNKVQERGSSSSSEEEEKKRGGASDGNHGMTNGVNYGCPQSEPVRRKVYASRGKTVAFNLNYENVCNNYSPPYSPSRFDAQEYSNKASAENLRQQVLLNTIANLKRNLEDQSASLKQVYRSSQNLHL